MALVSMVTWSARPTKRTQLEDAAMDNPFPRTLKGQIYRMVLENGK